MRLRGRRDSPENRHQYERRAEVGYDGSRVFLQLVIKSSRRKSRDRDVLEGSVVLVIPNGVEELVLPCSTSESSAFRKKNNSSFFWILLGILPLGIGSHKVD